MTTRKIAEAGEDDSSIMELCIDGSRSVEVELVFIRTETSNSDAEYSVP